MNNVLAHFKKEWRIHISDSFFLLTLVIVTAVAGLMGYYGALNYNSSATFILPTDPGAKWEVLRLSTIMNFWSALIIFDGVFVAILAAISASRDNESGMTDYVRTLRLDPTPAFLGKFLFILFFSTAVVILSVLMLQAVFLAVTGNFMLTAFAPSALVFPIAAILVIAMLGTAVATCMKKKTIAIVSAMSLCLVLIAAGNQMLNSAIGRQMIPGAAFDPGQVDLISRMVITLDPAMLLSGISWGLLTPEMQTRYTVPASLYSPDGLAMVALAYVAALGIIIWIMTRRNMKARRNWPVRR